MIKKLVKYAVILILLFIILTNAVYIEKLDAHQASSQEFDAKKYALNFWEKKLTPALGNAVNIDSLLVLLKNDKENTFNKYSHALGIGNIRFFLIKGQGEILSVNENDVTVQTASNTLSIATEYVFGNAVRDASGAIDINEFNNTMDFNNVSAEINKIIRTNVLPPFKANAKKGDKIIFTGAIELNREHLDLKNIEVIPVSIKPAL